MFGEIDKTIFPNTCEVLEIIPSQVFVYPIFKNGSSSLTESAVDLGWKIINESEISKIQTPITVFLRDPKERFISGVNTFLQHCHRDYKDLDTRTILFFVEKYLFLNRHYAPQFFWLINLSRYSRAPLKFQHINDIDQLTHRKNRADIAAPTEEFLTSIQKFPWGQLELYFLLDQLLIERIGTQTTFVDLVVDIKNTHHDLYELIFERTYRIFDALPKT
jgi:hypothetical protein